MNDDDLVNDVAATQRDGILSGLDEAQLEAARALRGPVCILAGAGTGKTRTITQRIAFGISTGAYAPERIMALTFTTRAAGEMKTRLRQLNVGDVASTTFHAAAWRQLRHFWPQVIGGDTPDIMKGKSQLLSEVSRKVGLRADKGVLRDIAADIEWRKVSNLTLENYAEVVSQRPRIGGVSTEQLMSVHAEFERVKDERRLIDFEDVLLLTAGLLATEEAALMEVRERYRFFVVDEYQDVSPLQHNLLSLWLGDRRDICVVGDASQTIYSFTGASSRYLLEFPSTFPDARVVRLETSYRSTAPIVGVANHIMRDRAGAISLSTTKVAGDPPAIRAYADDVAEARDVASKIVAEMARGTQAKDIAVLYRTNSQSAVLETALAELGVNYQVSGETRFFDMPEVKKAIMSLRGASVSATTDPLFKSVSDVMRSLGWTLEPPAETGSIRSRWEAFNAIVLLADQAPEGTSLRDFSSELLARQEARHEPTMDAVTLSTIHSAKGLEWASVYVVGLAEGSLPIWYATSEEAINEERRVLYVAVTRAENRLSLSWAAGSGSHAATRVQSRFLAETGIGSRGETR